MHFFHILVLLAGGLSLGSTKLTPLQVALNYFRAVILCEMPYAWTHLDIDSYGCYCGREGSGTPVDDLDRCCQQRSQCYAEALRDPDCSTYFDRVNYYRFLCIRDSVICRGQNDKCEMSICECDKTAAKCVSRTAFIAEHNDLPSDRCLD